MSDDLTKLMVMVEANTKSYQNSMKKLESVTKTAMDGASGHGKKFQNELLQIEKGTGRVGRSVAKMEREIAMQAAKAAAPFKLNQQQLMNMQFQMNDIATMLASGQSPFVMMMQQGMQIGQLFGPGSTVQNALKATGAGIMSFLTNPINLAVVGVAVAAGAIGLLWDAVTGPEAKTSEQMLTDFNDLIGEVEKSYSEAAKEARQFIEAAQGGNVLQAMLGKTETQLRDGLGSAIESLYGQTQAFIVQWKDINPELLRTQQEVRGLGNDLKDGTITVADFRDGISQIRLDDDAPDSVKEMVDRLLDATESAKDLEAQLGGVAIAAANIANVVNIDPSRFDTDQKSEQEIMGDLANKLRSQSRTISGPKIKKRRKSKEEREREKALREIEREQEAIAKLMETLEAEIGLVGASDVERAKSNALRSLGASATEDQKNKIMELTEILHREKAEWESLTNAQNFFADTAANSIFGVIDGTKKASDAMQDFARSIQQAALQALLLGKGPLAGIFGTGSGGGLLTSLMGGILGRAGGGMVSGSTPYMVGERGPELFVPNTAGKIVPNQQVAANQNTHVTVGVSADNNGNLMPFVESVSRRNAQTAVQRSAPGLIRGSVAASQKSFGANPGGWRSRA